MTKVIDINVKRGERFIVDTTKLGSKYPGWDWSMTSKDGKRTQAQLYKKLCQITHGINRSDDPDEDIVKFIIESFVENGFIETYNQLGFCGWKEMMTQFVESEIYERTRK